MTYTAFETQDLEKEGYDPTSEEYYAEVDKELKLTFRINLVILQKRKRPLPFKRLHLLKEA